MCYKKVRLFIFSKLFIFLKLFRVLFFILSKIIKVFAVFITLLVYYNFQKPAPAPYIKEMNDAGQFYTNRVLKDWKEKYVIYYYYF